MTKVAVWGSYDGENLLEGHLKSLEHASQFGDLYVCVMPEWVIRENKGRYEIKPQEERTQRLEDLTYVEKAIPLSEDTTEECIEQVLELKPDIFVFAEEQNTYADKILSDKLDELGTQIKIIPRQSSESTSYRVLLSIDHETSIIFGACLLDNTSLQYEYETIIKKNKWVESTLWDIQDMVINDIADAPLRIERDEHYGKLLLYVEIEEDHKQKSKISRPYSKIILTPIYIPGQAASDWIDTHIGEITDEDGHLMIDETFFREWGPAGKIKSVKYIGDKNTSTHLEFIEDIPGKLSRWGNLKTRGVELVINYSG